MEKNLIPIHDSYWVIPGRFRAGEYPGCIQDDDARRKLRWLLSHSINLMLDLTEAGEAGLKPYVRLWHEEANKIHTPVVYKRMPVQDFTIPSHEKMMEILNFIDLSITEGKNIYLHCFGGYGRTGTVVGCYLVRHGSQGDNALAKIQEFRRKIPDNHRQSPETEGQRRMVIEWTKGK